MATGIGDNPLEFSWPLSSVVADICDRAGVPYDVLDLYGLDQWVDGFYCDNTVSSFTALQNLSKVFMFDPSTWGGMIKFVPRGGNIVAELTSDDLIDDGEQIEQLTKRDSISIARVYHLNYYDIDGGLNNDIQTSDRSIDSRATQEVSTETNVLLQTNDAARATAINHKVAIEEQRGTYEFSLPDSWIKLTPGDIVSLNGERLRISEVEINDGYQKYKCQFDRQSAYQSTIVAEPIAAPSTPPTLVIGDTILHFIDSPIIKDSDDRLGYYMAVCGATTNWSGALCELSTDGGITYSESYSDTAESTVGVVVSGCGAHSKDYPDEASTIRVQLARTDLTLESASLAQMMSRANLAMIGNEIINFGNIDEVSPGVYDLSYLLRGRKGSPVTSHLSGERFILLERQFMCFIDADLFQLEKQLTFRVSSFGKDTSLTQTVSFTGKSQTENAPEYLSAYRSGGNITISWQGVGRLGGSTAIGMGAYFTGYQVSVNGTTLSTANKTLTVTDPGGSVTILVSQINQITGAGPSATITI